jgi:hypothetical protein
VKTTLLTKLREWVRTLSTKDHSRGIICTTLRTLHHTYLLQRS